VSLEVPQAPLHPFHLQEGPLRRCSRNSRELQQRRLAPSPLRLDRLDLFLLVRWVPLSPFRRRLDLSGRFPVDLWLRSTPAPWDLSTLWLLFQLHRWDLSTLSHPSQWHRWVLSSLLRPSRSRQSVQLTP
jgi:hypothetical protein